MAVALSPLPPATAGARSPAYEDPYGTEIRMLPGTGAPAPRELHPGVWRGDEFGTPVAKSIGSGWDALDHELPGAGWPCHSLTEILSPQPSVLEWRLLGGALRRIVSAGGQVVLVGPPKTPHLPGLIHEGLDQKHLVWLQADAPAERLWTTEQLVKGNCAGAIVAWLPQARAEQIRRLQVCALACEAPVFLCRPEAARAESSAAPLRVHASFGMDWELKIDIFKRRGPAHAGILTLPSVPGGLAKVLTPRLQRPSRLILTSEVTDALGRAAPRRRSSQHLAVH